MSDIRILPDIVVSRIAAGEVIERPYSVVKELVENSIDARADKIRIELRSGGKRYICVNDNGTGMSRDNAIMSLERHATSKISDVNDIFSVKTLGFRGEALPSIASVSDFILRTRTRDDVAGTEIRVHGGIIKKVREEGCPPGTTVEVRRLFFNTPPRLKFMKTVETELGRIIDVVHREAISNYGVSFELIHNGGRILDLRKSAGYIDRISDIIPGVDLFEINEKSGDNSLLGYLSAPLSARSTTQKLFTFVNGRPVKDRFLTRIIMDGYGKQIERGRFPQGAVFLQVPSTELDINVHPTKHEIRFRNQKIVADLIRDSIASMISRAPWLGGGKAFNPGTGHFLSESSGIYNSSYKRAAEMFSNSGSHGLPHDTKQGSNTGREQEAPVDPQQKPRSTNITHFSQDTYLESPGKIFGEGGYFSSLDILGQIHNLYIVCENSTGLVIIDQHAAHERINYEKVKRNYYKSGMKHIQDLLIPEVIELSRDESYVYERFMGYLESLGFITERFGENTVRITGVPSLLGVSGTVDLFRDLLGELDEIGEGDSFNEKIDLVFATIACHSSVRASQTLGSEQIKGLLEELDKAESPFHCPHGRPVVRELSFDYLERLFGRT